MSDNIQNHKKTTNYFIGIGGTGSKVLEALVHLSAAGLMYKQNSSMAEQDDLYVIIIDPDRKNGNIKRAMDTFDAYKRIKKEELGTTPLMSVRISKEQPDNYLINGLGSDSMTLQKAVNLGAYDYNNTAVGDLFKMLYTEEEQSTTLDKGFYGHPSIGAAVFAKTLSENTDWKTFVGKIIGEAKHSPVKIFLAGSIFGGTGAAGVPNIAKIIKDEFLHDIEKDHDKAVNWDNCNIEIGGGLVLPYFACTKPADFKKMCVSSNEFWPNTQAALSYYNHKMKDEPLYRALYLIGAPNDSQKIGDFSIGGDSQKNDAHVVDLYTALAAMHFFSNKAPSISDINNKCFYTACSENGVAWTDFPSPLQGYSKEDNKRLLTQYIRFALSYWCMYRDDLIRLEKDGNAKEEKWHRNFKIHANNFTLNDDSYGKFDEYINLFLEWCRQINIGTNLFDKRLFGDTEISKSYKDDYTMWFNAFPEMFGETGKTNCNTIRSKCGNDMKNQIGANGFGHFMRVLYESCTE